MMAKILRDIPLIEHVFEYDVILVPMGINCSMNQGFANEIGVNFSAVKEEEQGYKYGDKRKYGTTHVIKSKGLYFCLCYIHNGGYSKAEGEEYVNYEHLSQCLKEVDKLFRGKKIGSPILGCSKFDGNGSVEKVVGIFDQYLTHNDVTLFDYEQRDVNYAMYTQIAALHNQFKAKEISPEEFTEKRTKLEWERLHGIYDAMPDDYVYTPRGDFRKQSIKITQKDLTKKKK